MKDSPDGPWCQKCDPDAPRRFHVEEAEYDRYSNEEDEAYEEELDRQKDEHAQGNGGCGPF